MQKLKIIFLHGISDCKKNMILSKCNNQRRWVRKLSTFTGAKVVIDFYTAIRGTHTTNQNKIAYKCNAAFIYV